MAVATASHLGTSASFTVTSSVSRSGSTVTVKLSYALKTNYPGAYYANGWIRDDNVSSPSWVKVTEKTDATQGGFTVSGSKTYTYTQDGSKTYSYTIQAGCQGAKGYSVQYGSTNTVTASISARTYTISYNKGANGTGTNTSATKTHGTALTLKGAIFTRTGYTQTGWSTSDGGSKAYNLSASYTTNAAVTLYPYWTANTYTVSYNKGANGTGTNTSDTKTHGVALTLKGAIFTRSGYTQTGWSTSDGGSKAYNLSASYTSNAAVTLYPYWEKDGFNIYQASNGTVKQVTAIYSVNNGAIKQITDVYRVNNGTVTHV